ncbi:hypothetical protein [Salinicoccus halodurans]|uniref:Uncharacterized protein n=1 Tax=Salinicoccus halodurans TaxID=407035 RepID=A0A0F7D513_9STAP|nr:hypothetical protein [Salinicoccus halodurans]AKG75185.1 hypothetical protein AAT16_13935 [Salinicoccus halodurans]SFK73338.1 hypothetical protein SAMN05216235_1360 [Salinicoccus halodurans]
MVKKNEIVKFKIVFEFTEGQDANVVISDIVSFHDGQNIHEKMEKAESVAKDLGEGLKNKIIKDEFICVDTTFFRSNLIKAFTLNPDYDSLK